MKVQNTELFPKNNVQKNFSICIPHYRVPWLQGKFNPKIVKDKDDIWKKCLREQDYENLKKNSVKLGPCHLMYISLQIIATLLCFTTFLLSFILHGFTIHVIIDSWKPEIVLDKIFIIMSIAASIVIGK